MAETLKATIDDSSLRRLAKNYPQKAPMMISRAINKAGVFGRKEVVKRLKSDVVNVPANQLKRRNVILKKGTRAAPGASINITGSRIPLINFATVSSKKQAAEGQPKNGVSYKIKPGKGTKRIKSAFIRRIGRGKLAVFVRAGADRLPLNELYGPSVPHAMKEAKVTMFDLRNDVTKRLEKEAASQVELLLSKR